MIGQMLTYILELPEKALSGDLFAIMISLIILYCLVYILVKSAKYMKSILKKLVLLAIILIAVYIFIQDFVFKVITYGFTPDIIIVGFTGILCGLFALLIALFKISGAVKKRKSEKRKTKETDTGQVSYVTPSAPENASDSNSGISPYIPAQISNFAKDNSLGMVIIYLIVAEFGIFSSKTIAAVNADTGFAFFILFMFAAVIFVKLTYRNYKTGLKHLAIAFILGFSLSIVLGCFWGGISLDVLLSKQYFATDALVALISGLSLSLFMSGKG